MVNKITNKFFNKNFFTFLVFLFITFVLWLMNALNKSYSHHFKVKVLFELPKNYANEFTLPSYLTLKVQSSGYKLIRMYFISKNMPLVFRYSELEKFLRKSFDKGIYLDLNDIKSQIEQNFLNNIAKIEDISPRIIQFKILKLAHKKVPVVPNFKLIPKDQYAIFKNLKITPDSIEIYSTAKNLDTINSVTTEFVTYENFSNDFDFEVNLTPINNVNFEYDKVKVSVLGVEQFTEFSKSFKIGVENLPDSLNMILIPSECIVKFKVPIYRDFLNELNKIYVYVDYSKLSGETSKANIFIKNLPEYVLEVKIIPDFVNYAIEKK